MLLASSPCEKPLGDHFDPKAIHGGLLDVLEAPLGVDECCEEDEGCDDCCDDGDGERIISLSTAALDYDSTRDDASVISDDDSYEHVTDQGEESPLCLPDAGVEGHPCVATASNFGDIRNEDEIVNLTDDSSDCAARIELGALSKPATPMMMPLAVPCVFNVIIMQQPQSGEPGVADKGKKSKAKVKKFKGAESLAGKPEARTTVMLRHLPRDLSRDALLELLDARGFRGKYDFVYVPINFVEQANLGYAFINLSSPEDTPAFFKVFDGFRKWPKPCATKVLRVGWSPHQGLAHLQRYRNSPIMHPSVPAEIQPLLFEAGRRVAFPSPTKTVRAPRLRGARGEPAFWTQGSEPQTDAA